MQGMNVKPASSFETTFINFGHPGDIVLGLFDRTVSYSPSTMILTIELLILSAQLVLAHMREIRHSAVIPIITKPEPGCVHEPLLLKFQPSLAVYAGCVPFAAVDADGNYSGCLPTGGLANQAGKCNSSPGQIYGRSGEYRNSIWLFYAWFFPKDINWWGIGRSCSWQYAIFWLRSKKDPQPYRLSYTSFDKFYHENTGDWYTRGTHAILGKYEHELITSVASAKLFGGDGAQPLLCWSDMPKIANTTLNHMNWNEKRFAPMGSMLMNDFHYKNVTRDTWTPYWQVNLREWLPENPLPRPP